MGLIGRCIDSPMLSAALSNGGIAANRIEPVEHILEDVFLALAGE